MPLFSIIIPVYNVQNYLSACVKSVVEQPGPRDWECILVDDGSTDQSGAMCDALAAELPGLKVIHRENGGLAAARNTGLKAATGDDVDVRALKHAAKRTSQVTCLHEPTFLSPSSGRRPFP